MSHAYTIEPATERHLRAIPGIEHAAASIFSEKDLPSDLRYLVTDRETLGEAQRQNRLWAAVDDKDNVVGFALARIVGGVAHLEEMDVHPDCSRQGIGSRLLDAVIEWARGGGYPGLTLITFRHLPWNAPFYERHGFTQIDETENSVELCNLLREEAEAGLDAHNRVAMMLKFFDTVSLA